MDSTVYGKVRTETAKITARQAKPIVHGCSLHTENWIFSQHWAGTIILAGNFTEFVKVKL